MKSSYSDFMQSKYFDCMFNAAIFDGSFRIYFHQSFESLALKIYFLMNQNLDSQVAALREHSKKTDTHAFILLYPTQEKFQTVFSSLKNQTAFSQTENWDEDLVLGASGQMTDEQLEIFVQDAQKQVLAWLPQNPLQSVPEIQL